MNALQGVILLRKQGRQLIFLPLHTLCQEEAKAFAMTKHQVSPNPHSNITSAGEPCLFL